MVADALKGDRLIGMVMLVPGHEDEYEGRPPVYAVGCAGFIDDVRMYPDGRYDIVLRGLTKFRITSEDQSRPYRFAAVEAVPEVADDEEKAALGEQRPQIVAAYVAIAPDAEPPPPQLTDEDLVNGLAQFLNLAPLDRQQLLEADGPLARGEALLSLVADSLETQQTVR
jgi:Lon protease-like protein